MKMTRVDPFPMDGYPEDLEAYAGTALFPITLMARFYRNYWANKDLQYWMERLGEEVDELDDAVAGGNHEHEWEREAVEVASICLNMLRHHGRDTNEWLTPWLKELQEKCRDKAGNPGHP